MSDKNNPFGGEGGCYHINDILERVKDDAEPVILEIPSNEEDSNVTSE